MTKRETYCTIRGLKVWATVGLMLILVLSSGPALATSRFTVTNKDTTNHLEVYIFHGDDSSCDLAQKIENVHIGSTESYGCDGNGTQRCKVIFLYASHKQRNCGHQTCNDQAVKVSNGASLWLKNGSCGWE